MSVAGRDEAIDLLHRRPAGAAPDRGRRALQVTHRLLDGRLVCGANRRPGSGIADAEEHAHALRGRERQVIRGHLDPARRIAKRLAGPGLAACEQRAQLVVVHLAVQPEPVRTATQPRTGSLAALAVVVLRAASDAVDRINATVLALQVVPGLVHDELLDRQHLPRRTDTPVPAADGFRAGLHVLLSDARPGLAVRASREDMGGGGVHVL